MKREISIKTQEAFDYAKSKGINILLIADLYGVRFAMSLLKSIVKTKENKKKSTGALIPKFKVCKENQEKALEKYISILEDSGIKIKYWKEPFIDEDTGEIVDVPRMDLYTV